MPQRFLRPGITNSERWNSIPFDCQSFYIRILTLVDDFGCCDGRSSVLLGLCFSVWNALNPDHSVNPQRLDGMLQRLAAEKLVEVYESEGKVVLQVTQWQERIREGARRRWPENKNPQQSAAIRSEALPPSPPSPPSSPPTPTPPVARESVREMVNQVLSKARVTPEANGVFQFLKSEIGSLYRRPSEQAWSYKDESALSEISRRENVQEEWRQIIAFRRSLPVDDKRYFPQRMDRLLQDWDAVLDRARTQKPPVTKSKPARYAPPAGAKPVEKSPEQAKKIGALLREGMA